MNWLLLLAMFQQTTDWAFTTKPVKLDPSIVYASTPSRGDCGFWYAGLTEDKTKCQLHIVFPNLKNITCVQVPHADNSDILCTWDRLTTEQPEVQQLLDEPLAP